MVSAHFPHEIHGYSVSIADVQRDGDQYTWDAEITHPGKHRTLVFSSIERVQSPSDTWMAAYSFEVFRKGVAAARKRGIRFLEANVIEAHGGHHFEAFDDAIVINGASQVRCCYCSAAAGERHSDSHEFLPETSRLHEEVRIKFQTRFCSSG